MEPEVDEVDQITFGDADYDGISDYLVNEREFSADRVAASLNRLKKAIGRKSQTLEQWFG